MLKLGTMVEYADQVGRIVARTIELQPKYDIMLANGTIRSYVREVDLIVRRPPESLGDAAHDPSGALAGAPGDAMSVKHD